MLKILWKRREIAPEEQFLLLSIIFSYLMLDFYVKTRIRFSLRDKRLFEITEVEITRVDCIFFLQILDIQKSLMQFWITTIFISRYHKIIMDISNYFWISMIRILDLQEPNY